MYDYKNILKILKPLEITQPDLEKVNCSRNNKTAALFFPSKNSPHISLT